MEEPTTTEATREGRVSSQENEWSQRVTIEEGDVRLVLELRGVRELTDADRARLTDQLWEAFELGDVRLALQDLDLCEIALVTTAKPRA